MRAILLAALLPCVTSLAASADDQPDVWQVRGIVLDEHGKPTDDFVAAQYWSSNGVQWDAAGKHLPADSKEERKKNFWKEEGIAAANPKFVAKHEPGGKFTIELEGRPRVTIFALNRDNSLGGYVSVEKAESVKDVTVRMQPLTRVHAKIYCPEAQRTPEFTMVIPHPPGDTGNYLHFMQCGSVRGECELLLPPGKYDLDVYSSSPEGVLPKLKNLPADLQPSIGGIRIDVPAQKDFDIGTLDVVLPRDKDGVPRDYTLYYGKQPPNLQFTDIRGLKKDFKLADLKGKWVLLDFWTLHCGPCIAGSLPKLTKLYDEHAADHDRFEIIAICDTTAESALTLEAYDKLAAPIIAEDWNGKDLPFPIVIDGEGRTTGLYGINGWPTALLIDPDGNMIKGDETLLLEKLKSR